MSQAWRQWIGVREGGGESSVIGERGIEDKEVLLVRCFIILQPEQQHGADDTRGCSLSFP